MGAMMGAATVVPAGWVWDAGCRAYRDERGELVTKHNLELCK